LSIFYGLEDVGLYNAILQISLLINFAMSSINGVLSPMISRSYANENFTSLEKILKMANRIIVGSSIVTGLFLLVLIKPLFSVLDIKNDILLITTFIILIIGQVVCASMGSIVNLLNMSGNFKGVFLATLIAFSLNLIFCLILIPKFGVIGAAISTSIGIISKDLISTVIGFKIFSFKFSNYDFRKKRKRN